uniref:Chemokine interleukin-8-like domain-containing protein n=1 Tax=Poecilia latipinna TaxID=48699 RepID=A0A3B3TR57_9TELE
MCLNIDKKKQINVYTLEGSLFTVPQYLIVFFSGPNVALHCCFMFSTRMVAKEQIRSYHITGPHCSKSAVLFVMMSGSYICVNPKLLWVQKIMKGLDKKRF